MKRSNTSKKAPKPEDLLEPQFIPYVATNRLSDNPKPEEVNKVFNTLLTELDYHGKKLSVFDGWSVQQKIEFIRTQEEYEKRVPAPQWIIEQLQHGNDPNAMIKSINISIRTARLTWIDLFCTSGGHILLLRELARLTAFSQNFHHSFPYKNEDKVNDVIKALKSIVDCRNGSHHMLYFIPGIDIITSGINKYDFPQFETLLYLLLPYVFMDSGPSFLVKSFKRLAKLNQQRRVFRVFSDVIDNNKAPAAKSEVLMAFINGLYTAVSDNFPEKIDVIFNYVESDLINVLTKLPNDIQNQFGPILPAFLYCIKSDLAEITQLFNGEAFRCGKTKDFINELNPKSIGAILLNLVSIKRNQPHIIDRLYAFIYNFLLFLRKDSADQSRDFNEIAFDAFEYALPTTVIESPAIPPESSIHSNQCYQYLHNEYEYVADGDFKLFCKSWNGGDVTNEINTLKDQLKATQEELEAAKTELSEAKSAAAAVSQEELANIKEKIRSESNEELEKLRSELEAVKAENEKLRASQQIIMDLASYVPADLQKINLLPLEVNQILPENRVDIKSMLNDVNAARDAKSGPAVQTSLNNLEKQLNLLINERSAIDSNANHAIKTVKDDRVALTAEFNQVKEIQTKIIYALKQGSLFSEFGFGAHEEVFTRGINLEDLKLQSGAGAEGANASGTAGSNVSDANGTAGAEGSNVNGANGSNASVDVSSVTHENVALSEPLLNFPWDKLPPEVCAKSELWREASSIIKQGGNGVVDTDELLRYFAVGVIPSGKLISERTEKKFKKIVTKTKLSPESITRELNAQSFKLGEDTLNRLLHVPVCRVEVENLTSFSGDIKSLSDGERLGVLLYRIPDWRNVVAQSIELHRFDHDFTITMQNLDKIISAIQSLQGSKTLPAVISAVLSIANNINGGTKYGGASGFSLMNLKDLKSTKSSVKGVSLLNYIVYRLDQTKKFDFTEFQNEISKLQPATRYNLLDINEKLKNAQVMLAGRRRTPFVRACSRRVFDAMKKVNSVQSKYNEIEMSYGIQEELLRPGYLLPCITDFGTDFSRAIKENRTNSLKTKIVQAPSSPALPKAKPAEESTSIEGQRGYLNTMVGVLCTSRMQDQDGKEVPSDFDKAFAKVRKSMQ